MAGLTAIGSVISDLLKQEGGGNKEIIEKLSDAGRLLSDLHYTENACRKELILLNLNKELKDTLSEAPSDEWLFGENLDEVLKNARSLQLSSKQLKAAKPVPKKLSKHDLNFRRPLKNAQSQGTRVSGRYQRVPGKKTPQRPHQARLERPRAKTKYRRR